MLEYKQIENLKKYSKVRALVFGNHLQGKTDWIDDALITSDLTVWCDKGVGMSFDIPKENIELYECDAKLIYDISSVSAEIRLQEFPFHGLVVDINNAIAKQKLKSYQNVDYYFGMLRELVWGKIMYSCSDVIITKVFFKLPRRIKRILRKLAVVRRKKKSTLGLKKKTLRSSKQKRVLLKESRGVVRNINFRKLLPVRNKKYVKQVIDPRSVQLVGLLIKSYGVSGRSIKKQSFPFRAKKRIFFSFKKEKTRRLQKMWTALCT